MKELRESLKPKHTKKWREYAGLLRKPRSFMLGLSYAGALLVVFTSMSTIFAYRFLGVINEQCGWM